MKALVPGVGYLPEFLAREAPEAPQNIKAIAYVKRRCKTPWLRTPHAHALTADGRWRTVTIIPIWLWTLHAKILTCQAECTCLCNSGSAIVSETNQNHAVGFKAHCTRKSSFTSDTISQDKNLGLRGGPKSQWGSNFYGFTDGYDVPVKPAF